MVQFGDKVQGAILCLQALSVTPSEERATRITGLILPSLASLMLY